MTDTDPLAAARALIELLTNYTPGPWVRDCWDILGKAPGTGVVAEVCRPGELDSEFWKDGEPDNNARLIAAAPDLHAHLTAALDEIERLREALEQIAAQKRTDELVTALDVEFADFEDGYDLCIDCARAALKGS